MNDNDHKERKEGIESERTLEKKVGAFRNEEISLFLLRSSYLLTSHSLLSAISAPLYHVFRSLSVTSAVSSPPLFLLFHSFFVFVLLSLLILGL